MQSSEVKQLSSETSGALNRIREQVGNIQQHIDGLSTSVDGIAEETRHVDSNSTTVAAAVEEQTALLQGLRDSAAELLKR